MALVSVLVALVAFVVSVVVGFLVANRVCNNRGHAAVVLEKLGCLPKLKDDDQRQLILRLWEQLDPHSTGKAGLPLV